MCHSPSPSVPVDSASVAAATCSTPAPASLSSRHAHHSQYTPKEDERNRTERTGGMPRSGAVGVLTRVWVCVGVTPLFRFAARIVNICSSRGQETDITSAPHAIMSVVTRTLLLPLLLPAARHLLLASLLTPCGVCLSRSRHLLSGWPALPATRTALTR